MNCYMKLISYNKSPYIVGLLLAPHTVIILSLYVNSLYNVEMTLCLKIKIKIKISLIKSLSLFSLFCSYYNYNNYKVIIISLIYKFPMIKTIKIISPTYQLEMIKNSFI